MLPKKRFWFFRLTLASPFVQNAGRRPLGGGLCERWIIAAVSCNSPLSSIDPLSGNGSTPMRTMAISLCMFLRLKTLIALLVLLSQVGTVAICYGVDVAELADQLDATYSAMSNVEFVTSTSDSNNNGKLKINRSYLTRVREGNWHVRHIRADGRVSVEAIVTNTNYLVIHGEDLRGQSPVTDMAVMSRFSDPMSRRYMGSQGTSAAGFPLGYFPRSENNIVYLPELLRVLPELKVKSNVNGVIVLEGKGDGGSYKFELMMLPKPYCRKFEVVRRTGDYFGDQKLPFDDGLQQVSAVYSCATANPAAPFQQPWTVTNSRLYSSGPKVGTYVAHYSQVTRDPAAMQLNYQPIAYIPEGARVTLEDVADVEFAWRAGQIVRVSDGRSLAWLRSADFFGQTWWIWLIAIVTLTAAVFGFINVQRRRSPAASA